jgi:hypothetical protein
VQSPYNNKSGGYPLSPENDQMVRRRHPQLRSLARYAKECITLGDSVQVAQGQCSENIKTADLTDAADLRGFLLMHPRESA